MRLSTLHQIKHISTPHRGGKSHRVVTIKVKCMCYARPFVYVCLYACMTQGSLAMPCHAHPSPPIIIRTPCYADLLSSSKYSLPITHFSWRHKSTNYEIKPKSFHRSKIIQYSSPPRLNPVTPSNILFKWTDNHSERNLIIDKLPNILG